METALSIQQQTKDLIDRLKSTTSVNGLGNSGNEYVVIVQIFLYKFLNDKFVYSTVNTYLSLVTSKKKKSPHILRHSFATHVLEYGAEISKVKMIMGHSSLASTQVYTSANIEQLKKVFNSAHPRAKKNVDL